MAWPWLRRDTQGQFAQDFLDAPQAHSHIDEIGAVLFPKFAKAPGSGREQLDVKRLYRTSGSEKVVDKIEQYVGIAAERKLGEFFYICWGDGASEQDIMLFEQCGRIKPFIALVTIGNQFGDNQIFEQKGKVVIFVGPANGFQRCRLDIFARQV